MLYEVLHGLEKYKDRNRIISRQHKKEFVDSLDDLFDIAHSRARYMMKIKEDKRFLHMQRQKGRVNCMICVNIYEGNNYKTAES